jgi:predicted ribosomally synthesized peptide with SipW-like signal peptide
MKKERLISIMTICLVLSVIGAGTYAYLQDTETSSENTMSAGVLNIKLDSSDPYSGQIVQIMDLKPGYTRYSGTINFVINDNPGKVFKRISNVVCDRGLDGAVWFDLSVDGNSLIVDGAKKLSEVKDNWIYLGTFDPGVTVSVMQSFELEMCLPGWTGNERCTFNEEFMVRQTNDDGV